ncbi:amidohydrolase [Niastella yeongjuensis]|uniref:Amidohydrolase n=1 Tax=Niastella yeongjuensis TaxID=354355 RepID=A0A1V9E124_9BACT|nr:amidohydrolase family protein [Niastella yeongjuensis]OQP39761.1 amidohydrolase [Niastella yeongjuensis]SEO04420.1 Imidazolonepropionase [Niastella yeongjuensis]
MYTRYSITCLLLLLTMLVAGKLQAQDSAYLLQPDRVFDGEQLHENWQVLVKNGFIESAGAELKAPADARVIRLKGCTLLPGLIEGHSHLFLHPYNEVPWDDQVLKESRAERTARAVTHARATLLAGFTTVRDLGTEGAGYDDVGLKTAIEKGIVPGPHMLVATRAIVATGSYGPKSASADVDYPKGAAEVGNAAELEKEIRTQIGKGADLIKIYADYRWGPNEEAKPTFTLAELKLAVDITSSSGRQVVVHAGSAEAMRIAILAGVSTIEHGDQGTKEIFRLMKEKGMALCPTVAAGEAISQYKGWIKGKMSAPERVQTKRKSFAAALAAGVTICMGGDVGVFPHGDNAREMELLVEYGMKPIDVLRSATAVNADVFNISNKAGRIKAGLPADIIVVEGDPTSAISQIRKVKLVMKDGKRYN